MKITLTKCFLIPALLLFQREKKRKASKTLGGSLQRTSVSAWYMWTSIFPHQTWTDRFTESRRSCSWNTCQVSLINASSNIRSSSAACFWLPCMRRLKHLNRCEGRKLGRVSFLLKVEEDWVGWRCRMAEEKRDSVWCDLQTGFWTAERSDTVSAITSLLSTWSPGTVV